VTKSYIAKARGVKKATIEQSESQKVLITPKRNL